MGISTSGGAITGTVSVPDVATEPKQDDQIARMPALAFAPGVSGDPGTPVYLRENTVVVSQALGIAAASSAALASNQAGIPVRTYLDGVVEGTPDRLRSSLGFGALGEGAPGHLGTVAYPVSVHGADTAGGLQQLALDRTRADEAASNRLSNGTDFLDTTTGPAPDTAAIPVRQVGYGSGRALYHVVAYAIPLSTTPGTTKSLLAMTNGSLDTIRVVSIGLQNAQFTNITGALGLFAARRVSGAVTGGGAATVFVGPRKSTYPDLDAGITWNTGGTLPGSPVTLAARRLSTDDVTTSATDTTVHQFGYSTFEDIFRFHDDPVAVLAGEIVDVHLTVGAAISAGQFDVHFILET